MYQGQARAPRSRLIRSSLVGLVALVLLAGVTATAAPAHAAGPGDPPTNNVTLDMEGGLPLLYPLGLKVFNLYWDSSWNQTQSISTGVIDTATKGLLNSAYENSLRQYGVPDITFDRSERAAWPCASAPGATISAAAIFAFVECEVDGTIVTNVPRPVPAALGLPTDRIYNVILPAGTTVADPLVKSGSCNATLPSGSTRWRGFHAFVPAWPAAPLTNIHFTVTASQCTPNLATMMEVISHEIVEAATDPVPLASWADSSTAGPGTSPLSGVVSTLTAGEAADICASATPNFGRVRLANGMFPIRVAAYWSNFDDACVVGGDSASMNEMVVDTRLTAVGAPPGATVVINGTAFPLPFSGALFDGDKFTFSSPIETVPGSVRFIRGSACPAPLTAIVFPAGNTTANASTAFNCPYEREHMLSASTTPTAAANGNASLTPSGWRASSATVTVTADLTVPAGPDSRYELQGWTIDGLPATTCGTTCSVSMAQPHDVKAVYQLQHRMSFTATGLPVGTPWQVTVQGVPHSIPFDDWFDAGKSASFSYPPGSTSATTVITLKGVTPSSPVTVGGPLNVVASYSAIHKVTIFTKGLGSEVTTVRNGGSVIGTATDAAPLSVWWPGGAFALGLDDPVHGSTGTEYYLDSLAPYAPLQLNGGYAGTATYLTMHQIVDRAVHFGQIVPPASAGVAQLVKDDFLVAEKDLGSLAFDQALKGIETFLTDVQAATPAQVQQAASVPMQIDALKTYYWAMCRAVELGQVDPATHAGAYALYSSLWTFLTERRPLPDCGGRGGGGGPD
jgi:Divergent InlB B-repeat domain